MFQDLAPFSTHQPFQVGSDPKGRPDRKNSRFTDRSPFLICILFLVTNLMFRVGFSLPMRVQAQVGDTLIVLPPDTSDFPLLSTQIKPKFFPRAAVTPLQREALTVLEDGRRVEVISLEKRRGGVHFTLAINGDRRLDVRDVNGESPYHRIQLAFSDWALGRRLSSEDTLSLVVQEGPLISNSHDRQAWVETLQNYQPNFRSMTPDLVSLELALRLSEERVVPFGVDKALLYITPPPTPEEITPLLTLAETARTAEIQVYVWMLGEEFFLNNDQGRALINLANATGGEFFHFTGVGAPPDPERYFEDIGVYYDLSFVSGIRQEGTYAIRVETADGALHGESSEFYLNVHAPKPILISPPATITRSAPQNWDENLESLLPRSVAIEFMLEFPDGYPRDLSFSRLFVDGQMVDERTEAPFELLTWDLSAVEKTGEYMIQVGVEDTLGLSGETILTPIRVELSLPETEPPQPVQRIGLILVWVVLAGAALILVVWGVLNFFRSAFVQRLFNKLFSSRSISTAEKSPETGDQGGPFATLLPLESGISGWKQAAIQIMQARTVIGSDPERASLLLSGDTIDGLHARLQVEQGTFWLMDCGSRCGTWINYNPIGNQPVELHPGDLIHIGSAGFRFTIMDMESPPGATIEKYKLE